MYIYSPIITENIRLKERKKKVRRKKTENALVIYKRKISLIFRAALCLNIDVFEVVLASHIKIRTQYC